MTTRQLIWVTCVYGVAFIAVAHATRATARRAVGALAGGAVAGALFLSAAFLGERIGWWRGSLPSTAGPWVLFYLCTAISLSPIYPVTWRVARRFRWRGLLGCFAAAAVLGPPRDFL